MRMVLQLLALVLLVVMPTRGADLKLWYEQPAQKWDQALPVGSGRMGAMIFGGVGEERIQFNEDTLWAGKPHDYVREGSGDHLAEIRRLIFEGHADQAAPIVREKFLSDPIRQKAYQPFGDLRFKFEGHNNSTDYRRDLDIDQAIATTRYKIDEVTYTREVFASYPDNVIIVRLTADKPGSISFTMKMDSPHEGSQNRAIAADTLALSGQVKDLVEPFEPGLTFESRIRVINAGGEASVSEDAISVKDANDVTLLLVAATSFKNFQDVSADPAKRCEEYFARISGKSYEAIKAEHIKDYQSLFRRVSFDLGRTDRADLPTDNRVNQIRAIRPPNPQAPAKHEALPAEGLDSDPQLATLFFQFGRYLLIASSRPHTQPANLQGVWNELKSPPWESKYTTNINVEMNYWPAELTNLAECHEPLFDIIDDLRVSGARTARKMYNARGWVVHHNTDLWRGTAPINNIDGMWPTGGAWLCQHLWEHYLFTGDKEFLAKRAYPAMKEASLFFVDALVKHPTKGFLVTNPSHSPEQGPLNAGPTMDNQLIRALFTHTMEAAEILGTDKELIAELTAMREQLPPDHVGKHGQLQEWLDDVDEPNNGHRHMSPLWGLYPGAEITPEDPKIFDAAKVLLNWRGDGSTGWSYAWRIPLWARVYDGDFAYKQLYLQVARRTLTNLFDLCGPFQVDGNFGATAGIAEMLLQSHLRSSDGTTIIELLPALPKAWPKGSVTGLCARGGFTVDLSWDGGRLAKAVIHSKLGNPLKIKVDGQITDLQTTAGESYVIEP